jgi:Glyoxalase/Bleomycin resistance protein/Dioxygenase superfamily
MSLFFGAARQVGYVVRDIETAMKEWAALGVGPWFYKKDAGSTEFRYYGRESPPPKVSIALANSGELQLELVQQVDDAPSLYLDTLARNGEGAQHIAYWSPDRYDIMCRKLLEAGYLEGQAGRMGPMRGRYAYFVKPDFPSTMLEISETTGGKAEYFDEVRRAAQGWDGKDPIRRLGPSQARVKLEGSP